MSSLTEPGDRVLVLDNGIYGRGFADFVKLYGGIPEILHSDELTAFPAEVLEEHLKTNHSYAYATLVHCDTPSGVLNDIHTLCPILKKYGILTLVDSVSAMFGEDVRNTGPPKLTHSLRRLSKSGLRTAGTDICDDQ